jgi:hypothetical protein
MIKKVKAVPNGKALGVIIGNRKVQKAGAVTL